MGQARQEPLATVFALGTAWEPGWVLQRGGKEPSLDGDAGEGTVTTLQRRSAMGWWLQ